MLPQDKFLPDTRQDSTDYPFHFVERNPEYINEQLYVQSVFNLIPRTTIELLSLIEQGFDQTKYKIITFAYYVESMFQLYGHSYGINLAEYHRVYQAAFKVSYDIVDYGMLDPQYLTYWSTFARLEAAKRLAKSIEAMKPYSLSSLPRMLLAWKQSDQYFLSFKEHNNVLYYMPKAMADLNQISL